MSTARLVPVGPPTPLDLRAAVTARLRALVADLGAAAARVRAGDDREAVHDLRVACRRLASTLELWRQGLDPAATRRARRQLRRLRRRLSRTREREVLVAQLDDLLLGEPLAAREAGLDCRRRLGRRVARGHARAAALASRGRIRRLLAVVERAPQGPAVDSAAWLQGARDRTDARATAARAALTQVAGEEDDTRLHAARIAVKRWRYTLEALLAAGSDPRAEALRTLRDLQRCLGEVHDAAVMRDFLTRRVARAKGEGLPRRAAGLEILQGKADEARRRALERLPSSAAAAGGAPTA